MPAPGTAHATVKRELLVRYLDAAVPVVLHGTRRFTYAEGYVDGDASAVAAVQLFGPPRWPARSAPRPATRRGWTCGPAPTCCPR